MKLCFAVVLVVAAAASGLIEKRIVGSSSCGKERKYHVQISSVQPGKLCGGALLNSGWVLTAAHCAGQQVKLQLGLNSGQWFSFKTLGFLSGKSKLKEQIIDTNQQFAYQGEDQKPHDIMLIKLNKVLPTDVPTIKLPPIGCTKLETGKVRIGGFGPKTIGGKASKDLNCASTDIIKCEESDKPSAKYGHDEANLVCGYSYGVEACNGDGGTAVEFNGLLYGIVISKPVDKCASTIVMVDICFYRQWIEDTIRKN